VLGEALLSTGAITPAQLEQALARQHTTGALLGDILLSLNFITEETLARALAREADVPFVGATSLLPDPGAVALVPESFARKHLLAPLAVKGPALEVLQTNPFDVLALDDLRRRLNRPVIAACGTPETVRHLLDRCYSDHIDVGSLARAGADAPISLERETLVKGLSELGLSRKSLLVFRDILSKPRGMVLVTGPTGAGKTTTLYSALAYLGSLERNILTIEDPIESQIPTIRQTQIRPKEGFTFGIAIRSLLRQDPDVIMIGELRDAESAQLALHAALSRVLVFSTVSTHDSAGAIPRLIDMGLEPDLLASGIIGVVAQRLVRIICHDCKTPVSYPAEMLARVGLEPDPGLAFYRGRGCDACGGTGYRGRAGVFEILAVDGAIHALIRERANSKRIKDAAISSGMNTLLGEVLSKAIFGQTTLEEVLRVGFS